MFCYGLRMSIIESLKKKSSTPQIKNLDRAFETSVPLPTSGDVSVDGGDESCDTWARCIVRGRGGFEQSGIMLEVSPEEAHVRFVSQTRLPETFSVIVPRLGSSRDAQLVSQDGTDAVICFKRELNDPCDVLGS